MNAKEGRNMSRKELVSGIREKLAASRAARAEFLGKKKEEGAEYFRTWKLNGVSEGVLKDAEDEEKFVTLKSSSTEADREKATFKVRLLKAIRGSLSTTLLQHYCELYQYHLGFCEAMGAKMAEEAETTMFYFGAMEAALADCEAAGKAPEPPKETPVKIFKSKDTADFVARAINDWAELHGVEAQVSVWSCSRPDGGKFYTISSRDDAFRREPENHVLLTDGTFVKD